LSVQVLQEFYVTATRKLTMPAEDALRQVERFGKWTVHRPDVSDVVHAVRLHTDHQISYWDAMIVRSATQLGCTVLWSEDFNEGQVWGSLGVRNPFRQAEVR
jgi:predicted nucleic acid-binding protein